MVLPVADCCVTVTVCAATVSVPVRWLVLGLASARKLTVPFPLPLAPLVIVSQLALLVAAQLQPPAVLTLTLRVSPDAATDRLVGDTL